MTDKKPYEVVMPKLGLIMTEANLLDWFKSDGERVEKGELLFSFESDKSVVEIESPASGTVRILVEVGTTVPVQTPVAEIHPLGTELLAPKAGVVHQNDGIAQAPETVNPPNVTHQPKGLRATPKARKIARSRGIDLSLIKGTGPRGMAVTADLESAPIPAPTKATPLARKMAADCCIDLQNLSGTGPGGRITRDDVTAAIAALSKSAQTTVISGSPVRPPIPLDGLRGLIAERLSASWNERPQVTLHSEVDAISLVATRNQNLTPTGNKISFNAYFVAVVTRALSRYGEGDIAVSVRGSLPDEDPLGAVMGIHAHQPPLFGFVLLILFAVAVDVVELEHLDSSRCDLNTGDRADQQEA